MSPISVTTYKNRLRYMQYNIILILVMLLGIFNSSFFIAGIRAAEHHIIEEEKCNPNKKYDLKLIYKSNSETRVSSMREMAIWTMKVDKLLKEAGYKIFDTHHYHYPTVLNVPCPPHNTVKKVFKLIQNNDLTVPNTYKLCRHNPGLDSSINLLLSIEYIDSEILISGVIPSKSLTNNLLEKALNYKMTIKDPSGDKYTSKFTQPASQKVERYYPNEFKPNIGFLTPGNYILIISINNQTVWNTRFYLTNTNSIDWQYYNNESRLR